MRLSFIAPLLLAGATLCYAQQAMPRMTSVEPGEGKTGDVISVAGENLHKENVAKVFLTDGKNDVVAEVTEQAEKVIKIRIPKCSNGRFSLMLLTTGKEPKLIEQPVKLTVEQ